MEMAAYIMSILKSQLMIVFSWGFNSPVAIENGLKFKVQGYKHKGTVIVKYVEGIDLFSVSTYSKDGVMKETRTDVFFDELVSVIDNMVEIVPDYKERVSKDYGLNA